MAACTDRSGPVGLLRIKPDMDALAHYAPVDPSADTEELERGSVGRQGHIVLGLRRYSHLSSPIRRFVDLYNQHVLRGSFHPGEEARGSRAEEEAVLNDAGRIDADRLTALNERCCAVRRYQSLVASTALAYTCRGCPIILRCAVEPAEDGQPLYIWHTSASGGGPKRLRVSIHDAYCAGEVLACLTAGYEGQAEICGIRKAGRTQLRLRLPGLTPYPTAPLTNSMQPLPEDLSTSTTDAVLKAAAASTPVPDAVANRANETAASSPSLTNVPARMAPEPGVSAKQTTEKDDSWSEEPFEAPAIENNVYSCPANSDGKKRRDKAAEGLCTAEELDVATAEAEAVLGYALDSFQRRCLAVILDPRRDLLAVAPTGSGKTAVAAMAVLRAFANSKVPPANGSSSPVIQNIFKVSEVAANASKSIDKAPNENCQEHESQINVILSAENTTMANLENSSSLAGGSVVHRAVYTSPLKALSNQKYAEFRIWLDNAANAEGGTRRKFASVSAVASGVGVSLLTGDVKVRAGPPLSKELIICTTEILRNKLVEAGANAVAAATVAANLAAKNASQTPQNFEAVATLNEGFLAVVNSSESMSRFLSLKATAKASNESAFESLEGNVKESDTDLEGLACVVADEVHFISDPDRGAVWEETLMHLPASTQCVALSATVREPHVLAAWISKARRRPCIVVERRDRHVPLRIGGLARSHLNSLPLSAIGKFSNISIITKNATAEVGDFVCFFDTHGPRAGIFDQQIFHALFGPGPRLGGNGSRAALAPSRGGQRGRGGGRGGRADAAIGSRNAEPIAARGGWKADSGRFEWEVNRLVRSLDSQDRLPAIVFCMSRRACVRAAQAVEGNLLLRAAAAGRDVAGLGKDETLPQPRPAPPSEDIAAKAEWEAEEGQRRLRSRAAEAFRRKLHRQLLGPHLADLQKLQAFDEIDGLLKRGIGYHHAGMLPVLRELVELSYQARLVRVVFATETLAVGVNMPARTVVFTQLQKPDGAGERRFCRPDEFWQMAGRAGRRGMDSVGFVVYAPAAAPPTGGGAGDGGPGKSGAAPVAEMDWMLKGSPPSAGSQLRVDQTFVLRHLHQGCNVEVVDSSLLAHELVREAQGSRDAEAAEAASASGRPGILFPKMCAQTKVQSGVALQAPQAGLRELNQGPQTSMKSMRTGTLGESTVMKDAMQKPISLPRVGASKSDFPKKDSFAQCKMTDALNPTTRELPLSFPRKEPVQNSVGNGEDGKKEKDSLFEGFKLLKRDQPLQATDLPTAVRDGKKPIFSDPQADPSAQIKGVATAVARYEQLEALLGIGQSGRGAGMLLDNRGRRAAEREMKAIATAHGNVAGGFDTVRHRSKESKGVSHVKGTEVLRAAWDRGRRWLQSAGYVRPGAFGGMQLTPLGRACAAFGDGYPLAMGTAIAAGCLDALTLPEVAAWLCIFLADSSSISPPQPPLASQHSESRLDSDIWSNFCDDFALPPPSQTLVDAWDRAAATVTTLEQEGLGEGLGVKTVGIGNEMFGGPSARWLGLLLMDWCVHKDVARVAARVEPLALGTFVRAALRVAARMEAVLEVLMGLGKYEVHSRLDGAQEALLGGLISSVSLYVTSTETALSEKKKQSEPTNGQTGAIRQGAAAKREAAGM